MPSTSEGWMPASSRAALTAWQASDNSVPGKPLAKTVWPIPTIAVRSFMASGRSLRACRRQTTKNAQRTERLSPALELGGTALDEGGHALLGVLRAGDELLGIALVPEGADAVGVERSIGEPGGEVDGLRRAGSQAPGPLGEGLLQLGAGDDLVGQA